MRESHCIHTPALGYEYEFAPSTQTVDGKKHLVPREITALAHDLFEITIMSPLHDVDYLIFYGRVLCHTPPIEKQNALLKIQ
jgi:hypothetical protein